LGLRRTGTNALIAEHRRSTARRMLQRLLASARREARAATAAPSRSSADDTSATGKSPSRYRGSAAFPDALLITHPPHVRYLSGFTGSNAWLLLRPRGALLLTDPRYREQAAAETTGLRVTIVSGQTFAAALAGMHLHPAISTLGVEADHLSATVVANLTTLLRPLRIRPVSGVVEELRAVKQEDEISLIRRAIHISEQAFVETLPLLRPGVRDREIAAELSYRQRLLGADDDAFPPIVLFGARASLVHGRPDGHRLAARAPILIDFGCRVGGYGSDITRTLHIGQASPKFRHAYDVVRTAQQRGIDAARAGLPAAELDALVRDHIAAAGWRDRFEHGLGHGIGLEMHEAPHLSWRNPAPLEEGQVITIEPGVYFPGTFGIRIEDDLRITAQGAELLTRLPRTLQELEP
jgi:Xaa-Pro aminopeptidase